MSIAVEIGGRMPFFGGGDLPEVKCRFEPGRISALIGPNGSGKTTLLRLVAGLDPWDGGAVRYFDAEGEVAPGLALMRRMTMLPQSPALFNASLYNNVAFGLRARGLPEAEVRGRAAEALRAVGLRQHPKTQARGLSGGEAQRLALARAFALRPELLLLDEPSASLDPEGGALMEEAVKGLNGSGSTVIVVTHNLFQARRLADFVFFLYGGRLVERGPKERFFAGPSEELTRRFISGEVVY